MAIVPTTWNPADKGPYVTLSNGNKTANLGGQSVRSVFGASSGKYYFEFKFSGSTGQMVGIATNAASVSTWPGADAQAWAWERASGSIYHDGGVIYTGTAGATTVGVLLDCDAKKVQFRRNNVNIGPAVDIAGTVFYAIAGYYDSVIANFGGTAFTYAVPSGYSSGFGNDPSTAITGDSSVLLEGASPERLAWPTTWSPTDMAVGATLIDPTTADLSSAIGLIRSVDGFDSGKWYWEVTPSVTSAGVGVALKTAGVANYLGHDIRGWGLYDEQVYNNSAVVATVSTRTNPTVGIALDLDIGLLWYVLDGVQQAPISLPSGKFYASFSYLGIGSANFGARAFEFNPPPGFNHGLGFLTEPGMSSDVLLDEAISEGEIELSPWVNLDYYGWVSDDFGYPEVTGTTLSIYPDGFDESVVGEPYVESAVTYVSFDGIDSFLPGDVEVQNWIRTIQVDGEDFSALGYVEVDSGERSIAVSGLPSEEFGEPAIENKDRYLNQIGWASSVVNVSAKVWDGKQYLDNATLGDGMHVPGPAVSFPGGSPGVTQYVALSGNGIDMPDNQVWPLHAIENVNKQIYVDGFDGRAFGSVHVDQTVYLSIHPLGADWSVFGTAVVDQTIKKLSPEGYTGEFVSIAHQIYNFKIDVVAGGFASFVSGDHAVLRGAERPTVPSIDPTSVVPTDLRIEHRVRPVTPYGWDATIWGDAIIQDRNLWVAPGGIAPLPQTGPPNQWRIPAPDVDHRTKRVDLLDRGVEAPTFPSTHQLTHYLQYVDQAAEGAVPGDVGEPDISFRYRTIYPTFVASMEFGDATVLRTLYVAPDGWDSSFLSENAELLINTRRLHVLTGEADPAKYGSATVFNWVQNVNLDRNGWYDTQWNFPVVYNLKQEIEVGPFMDNLTPDQWGRYYPFVENKNHELRTFGHVSSRVSIAGWIHNKADPIFPVGTDMTMWGAGTFIAHRNRTVAALGWDSYYSERYTVVWNLADAVAPTSIGDTARYGTALVVNLNREVKQHSGWSGPDWGTPFVAYRVRTVAPGLFYDVPASFPEVRHNPFPIAPMGIPKLGQVGGHEVRIFRREVFPYALNVHDPWFGEAMVRNRNVEAGPYGYDQSEFGRAHIENFIRYVEPEGLRDDDVPKHLIGRRTRELNPLGIAFPPFIQLHRIRNLLPDPPGLQTIDLSRTASTGEVDDGDGIPPPDIYVGNPPRPTIRLNTIYPVWEAPAARFGVGRVWSTAIEPKFWQSDGGVGVPILIFTQYVAAKSADPAFVTFGVPRMSPFTIYAPQGSERPDGYTPSGVGMLIDNYLSSPDGSRYPWFGLTTVTNQHRAIGPVPYRTGADDLNGRTKWGTAAFTLRRQYIYVEAIRSLRMGFPVFWGVPQFVNLDDPGANAGIPPYNAFGVTTVAFPVDPHAPQYVYPDEYDATLWGENLVELLDRVVEPEGIPHSGNPQQYETTPWGDALVGYPRRYTIGMGSQTLWGTHVIEYVNRQVWPEGWNSCSLESWDFENYKFPMKVVRKNPPVRPAGFVSSAVGTCTVSQLVRTVYSRGVDSYNSGSHSVKASATIAVQGWESLLIGDIDRWEAGKIKAHGDDMSEVGIPRLLHPLRASGFDSSVVAAPRIAPVVSPVGIPNIAFDGPSVTNPFGCTNRVVSPLPILSNQTVPSPVVA